MSDAPSSFTTMHFRLNAGFGGDPLQRRHTVAAQIPVRIDGHRCGQCSALIRCRQLLLCSNERGLPGLGGGTFLARWDHRMRISGGNSLPWHLRVSYAPVHCPAGDLQSNLPRGRDTAWSLIGRDLIQQLGAGSTPMLLVISPLAASYRRACRAMDGPYFQRFFVDALCCILTPNYGVLNRPLPAGTCLHCERMLAGIPLAFTFGFDYHAIDLRRFSGPLDPRKAGSRSVFC